MRKKFKIMYPEDYHDTNLRGKPYLPPTDNMVVMNGRGIFYLVCTDPYNSFTRKLSNVLHKYDVVWT